MKNKIYIHFAYLLQSAAKDLDDMYKSMVAGLCLKWPLQSNHNDSRDCFLTRPYKVAWKRRYKSQSNRSFTGIPYVLYLVISK